MLSAQHSTLVLLIHDTDVYKHTVHDLYCQVFFFLCAVCRKLNVLCTI